MKSFVRERVLSVFARADRLGCRRLSCGLPSCRPRRFRGRCHQPVAVARSACRISLAIRAELSRAKAEVRSLSARWESIAVGAILVDASGRPVFVNEAAERVLGGRRWAQAWCRRPLRLHVGRHRAAARQAIAGPECGRWRDRGRRWAAALSATVFAPAAPADGAPGMDARSMASAEQKSQFSCGRVTADRSSTARRIAIGFDLTPRESDHRGPARGGLPLVDIARRLAVCVPRRAIPQRVFDKTGTHRALRHWFRWAGASSTRAD